MEFKIEIKGLKEAMENINPKHIIKAGKKSIRRAAGRGKTIISSKIREEFNIKKSDLDKKIKVDLSRLNNLKAELVVTGEPISLTYFNPKQISGGRQTFISKDRGIAQKRTRSKAGGVTVKIKKGKTTRLRSAFIARGRGGTPMVFRREGKKRLPIRALKVIGYASILNKRETLEAVLNRIDEQLIKEWMEYLKK